MTEPLMAISNGGLSIISPELAEKIQSKKISPSLITSLKNCPAQWVANSYVIPTIVPEEDDNAASRGSLFHKVMEVVFAEAPEVRTREFIDEVAKQVIETDEFSQFKGNEDAWEWLQRAIDGYYRMGGRPEKVNIAEYLRAGEKEPKKGLEVFVKGNLGGAERDTLGFIDRLAEDRKHEGGVIIEDWKTGAKAKIWNPKTKSEDGKAEARQQIIYSMLLKQSGVNVTGARLIYPVAGVVVNVDVDDEAFNEQVLKDIKETDEALTTMIETNLFEFRPNFLCAWCPLQKACPAAQIGNFQKARDAAKKAPPIEVLAKGFDFI